MADDRFEILFVCHANLCRSPMAERFARDRLDKAFGPAAAQIVVSSAGTHAFVGEPMHPGSARVLVERGVDPTGFVSRQLSAAILAGVDLVLAAGRDQRAACVSMAPTVLRRSFTLRQFARFGEAVSPARSNKGSPPQRLRALLDEVAAVRSNLQPVPGREDDLADPVGQPIEAFRSCADETQRSLSVLINLIAPA